MMLVREDFDWYKNRRLLKEGMVFWTYADELVKLDRRVPGDGTKWYVADYSFGDWGYYDGTAEPSDFRERREDLEETH